MSRKTQDLYHHAEKRTEVKVYIMPDALKYFLQKTGARGPGQALRLIVEQIYLKDLENKVADSEVKRRMGQ